MDWRYKPVLHRINLDGTTTRLCPCGNVARPNGQGNCKACHAAAARKHYHLRGIPASQLKQRKAREKAMDQKKRGTLVPQPCVICGADKAEMHHPDYDKPLDIIWLCRPHHLGLHKGTVQLPEAPNGTYSHTDSLGVV